MEVRPPPIPENKIPYTMENSMNNEKSFLWVEKYRPQVINDCVLPSKIKQILNGFISKSDFPNFLFSGPPGIGKTTAAIAMMKEIDSDYIVINGNNEGRLIDTLRNSMTSFATSVSLSGKRKYIIVDEADNMFTDVQNALKGFMEKYSNNCGFIFTCNFKYKIIEPLHSRCTEINFKIPKDEKLDIAKDIIKRLKYILKTEEIQYDSNTIASLVMTNFPDFRQIINKIQMYSSNGVIDTGILADQNVNIEELFKYLKTKNFGSLRKWVVHNTDVDITSIIRKIYDNAEKYITKRAFVGLIVEAEEYLYKSAFVADKELTLMAFLCNLMADLSEEDYV